MKIKNIILIALFLAFFLVGCDTEIPEDDIETSEDALEEYEYNVDIDQLLVSVDENGNRLPDDFFIELRRETNPDYRKTPEELTREGLEFARDIINGYDTIDYFDSDEFKRLSPSEKAERILEFEVCDATMKHINLSVEVAQEVMILGDEELGFRLIEWAKEAYRAFVVEVAMAPGAHILDKGIDIDEFRMEEGLAAMYNEIKKTRLISYVRYMLAQIGQGLGFFEVTQDIISGNYIEPVCVQLWDVKFSIDYDKRQIDSMQIWSATATLNDVPIYKYSPTLGFRKVNSNTRTQGVFILEEMWWSDQGPESPYMGTIIGNPNFKIEIYYDGRINFWDDILKVSAGIDSRTTEPIIRWTDGQEVPFTEFLTIQNTIFDIDTTHLWKRESFSYSEALETGEYYMITGKFEFTPTRRVEVEELMN